jgi:hypothetical protein
MRWPLGCRIDWVSNDISLALTGLLPQDWAGPVIWQQTYLNKLKAIKEAKLPMDIKTIDSLSDFATSSGPI